MNLLRTRKDAELTELSNQLAAANATLTAKVAQLKKENHYLRRGNRIMPHVRLVYRAYAGAQILALWHCGGYRTGRKASIANGMSDRTWYAARALLMVGRVHNGRGFTTDEPSEIETALLSAVKRCELDPAILHARLPHSRKPKPRPKV